MIKNSKEMDTIEYIHPKCKEVVKRRLGMAKRLDRSTVYLELEDQGGKETVLSHPKATILTMILLLRKKD